jgi:hypothetical protein
MLVFSDWFCTIVEGITNRGVTGPANICVIVEIGSFAGEFFCLDVRWFILIGIIFIPEPILSVCVNCSEQNFFLQIIERFQDEIIAEKTMPKQLNTTFFYKYE